jgi:hypothetical protein
MGQHAGTSLLPGLIRATSSWLQRTYLDQDDVHFLNSIILIQAHQPFTAPMVRPDWKYLLAYRNNTIKGMVMITAVAAK